MPRKGVRVAVGFVASMLTVTAVASCDPCAGTPSCTVYPEVSYGGQFIERRTGAVVPGVQVMFIRESGLRMPSDTIRAVGGADGFFQLRSTAHGLGRVFGRLIVTPPPPWETYTVPNLALLASDRRGEGISAGRLVVDPYSMFIGEIIDRRFGTFGARVPNAEVTLRLLDGVATAPESISFVTDELGRFLFEPTLTTFGDYRYEVTLKLPHDAEVYRFVYKVTTDFQDRDPYPLLLKVPRVLRYTAEFSRRGTGEFLPGVQVMFVRTGGIQVDPDTLMLELTNGRVGISPTPLTDGVLIGDLIVTPPAPLKQEILRDIELETNYDDSVRLVGVFGYGPAVAFRAQLRQRANDLPLEEGTPAFVKRIGGLPLVYAAGADTSLDTGQRDVDSLSRVTFVAATADTGAVVFRIVVNPPRFAPETLRMVTAHARNDSVTSVLGPYRVGGWLPWYGEVRESGTDAPIAGAQVQFQRTAGVEVNPATFTTTTGADGRFRISAVPSQSGAVTGTLAITFPSAGGAFRDSTVAGLQLGVTQDDTLRLLGVYRFTRQP